MFQRNHAQYGLYFFSTVKDKILEVFTDQYFVEQNYANAEELYSVLVLIRDNDLLTPSEMEKLSWIFVAHEECKHKDEEEVRELLKDLSTFALPESAQQSYE